MICHFNTSAHDGRDLLPVRLGLRADVHLACAGCRADIAKSAFLRVVDRRVTDLPVLHERRGWKPAWMSRLTARDETGRVA